MNIPWSHRDGLDPDAPPPDDFPQRAWCFSSDWLDHGLARTLGLEAVAATVENVHYLPGRHLKVVYRLAPGHLPERVTLDFATPADTGPDDELGRRMGRSELQDESGARFGELEVSDRSAAVHEGSTPTIGVLGQVWRSRSAAAAVAVLQAITSPSTPDSISQRLTVSERAWMKASSRSP